MLVTDYAIWKSLQFLFFFTCLFEIRPGDLNPVGWCILDCSLWVENLDVGGWYLFTGMKQNVEEQKKILGQLGG